MNSTNERYHALDSMRATMMLLGIYLHVVVGYSGDGHWPYIDLHPTPVLNWTLGVIHAFRMPAFYAVAGFFGALLWDRRGVSGFAANRARRVALPFLLFWAILFPLMATIVINLARSNGKAVPNTHGWAWVKLLHPLHLWFLEYLILLYAIAGIVAWMWRRVPDPVSRSVRQAFRWVFLRSYAPCIFALFSWLPLAWMHGNLKDCDGFTPEWRILVAYLVPFGFGWMLYGSRDLLSRFKKHVWVYLILSAPAFFAYGLTSSDVHPFLKAAGNVLLCWFLLFACTGLFMRYCSRESPGWRYMSDSSYWLYIMHMPIVVGLQVAFLRVPLSALTKVPIVLALSVAILVVSYDCMVRPTWIGALLNGRRYPRRLPQLQTATAPATTG